MPALLPILLLFLAAAITGCHTSPPQATGPSGASDPRYLGWAIWITGYEVPLPPTIPYDDEGQRREYLRFFHQAYLTMMWDVADGSSSIMPRSEHPQAATKGHYDGLDQARIDKTQYWKERGVEFRPIWLIQPSQLFPTSPTDDPTPNPPPSHTQP